MVNECIYFIRQLVPCHEGLLDVDQLSGLKKHLENCGTCRSYLQILRNRNAKKWGFENIGKVS